MGGGDSSKEASMARLQEEQRENRIAEGTKTIRKQFGDAFGDAYYKKFEEAGKANYQIPIDRQYNQSLKNLQAALARNGLLDSTSRVRTEQRLKDELGTVQGQVGEEIKNQIQARKSDVANQEAVAVGQLQSSADTSASAAQTANLINSRTALPGWSALGQVFTDASAALANQADAERSGNAKYNIGVSRWGDNARRYLSNIG